MAQADEETQPSKLKEKEKESTLNEEDWQN